MRFQVANCIQNCSLLTVKVIDACAFRVYAHWVKKGDGQNRAELFENHPKVELKHLYLSNLNPMRM